MASELIERSLYNGLYEMVHNPFARGRAPRYVVNGSMKPAGVTTILGKVIAKDLMEWAVSCAMQYLEPKLPRVTKADLESASNEYKYRRDSGASTGTEAHALVEQFLKGVSIDSSVATQEARNAYKAFIDWYRKAEPEVINVEEVIYSKDLQYAGTYDCMLRIDGKVYLCDLKTTNASRRAPDGVYAENFIQLGAYAMAHEEQRVYEEANGGTKLVPIEGLMVISAKKDGVLNIITNDDLGLTLEECTDMFISVINLFNFLKFTTKQLGGK